MFIFDVYVMLRMRGRADAVGVAAAGCGRREGRVTFYWYGRLIGAALPTARQTFPSFSPFHFRSPKPNIKKKVLRFGGSGR